MVIMGQPWGKWATKGRDLGRTSRAEGGETRVCSPVSVPVHTSCTGLGLKDFNERVTSKKSLQVAICDCRICTTNRLFLHFLLGELLSSGQGDPKSFLPPYSQSRLQDIFILNWEICFCITLALLSVFTPDLWFLSSEMTCAINDTDIYRSINVCATAVNHEISSPYTHQEYSLQTLALLKAVLLQLEVIDVTQLDAGWISLFILAFWWCCSLKVICYSDFIILLSLFHIFKRQETGFFSYSRATRLQVKNLTACGSATYCQQ